ncbi:MAG: hypothetical protein FWH36_03485 [Lentimicrobiaceae bacterium]|nr:hypothetical protein [Lentimicrobiaceae bacterium]
MRKVIKTGILLFVIVSFCRCDTAQELINMLNCKFERKDVDNFRFAGVDFDKFNSFEDIGTSDVLKISTALLKGTAPITFNMNLEGRNPNKTTAGIEQFRWIFLMDGDEILNGNIVDKFSIPAEGTSILPIEIGFDAMQFLDGSGVQKVQSLFNLYQNITGKNASQTSNASLKIKPTINGKEFPQYITLN